tara:strand:+ start:442 stop:723 length:282 start_codon:yes stop_codon:yes gene_type:complete
MKSPTFNPGIIDPEGIWYGSYINVLNINIKKIGINQLLPEPFRYVLLMNIPVTHITRLTIVASKRIILRSPAFTNTLYKMIRPKIKPIFDSLD